jgi:uncharacterized protein YndB with AHSA1/START domain
VETTTETTVERELEIAASPETVWEFLVDQDKAVRWMGLRASFEPRPGGLYEVDVIPGHTVRGEFVELDPPRRLVFTWGWEPGEEGPHPVPPGSSTVEIELEPEGEETRVRFTHRDLPGAEAVESHAHGWDHYLERLAIAARGDEPGPDPWVSNRP